MNIRILATAALSAIILPQCTWLKKPDVQVSPPQSKKQPEIARYAPGKRQLFVFLDGTNNDWDNRTNPRRLFEMIAAREQPSQVCCYISGVGVKGSLAGLILGGGMKRRILEGYGFLSKHYRPGDEIYIFGFSRGSLQARTLAGMISYCGLLPASGVSSGEMDKVWDYCRRIEEQLDHEKNKEMGLNFQNWGQAMARRQPPAPLYLQNRQPVQGRYAEVTFLGVWDTVPGSQLKDYGPYREIEDNEPGTRYKIGAYPPIRQIAHAMSLDETRSQFRPVQVEEPISKARTRLEEVWFSGVHSDVGGGYADSNALSGVSMNWMIASLNATARFQPALPFVYANPYAPQHDELVGGWGGFGSHPEYRRIHGDKYVLHPSVSQRIKHGVHFLETKDGFKKQTSYSPKAGEAEK